MTPVTVLAVEFSPVRVGPEQLFHVLEIVVDYETVHLNGLAEYPRNVHD
jgi:hypothetical protein